MSGELITLLVVCAFGVVGYLLNCWWARKWLTWKEWGEFNGD